MFPFALIKAIDPAPMTSSFFTPITLLCAAPRPSEATNLAHIHMQSDDISRVVQNTHDSSMHISSNIPPPVNQDSQHPTAHTAPENHSGAFISSASTALIPHNHHPMITRAKSGITKKHALHASISLDPSLVEPQTYRQAMKLPEWYKAMQEEYQALQQQQTWSLVPLPASRSLVGRKWVFKLKKNVDGSISRHKPD